MEEPDKHRSHFNHHIKKRFTANVRIVCAGVTGRNAKGQFILTQQIHRPHDFFKNALSPASVIRLLKSLQADCRNKILYPEHFLAKGFIDQSSIRKRKELAIRMAFTQRDQILFPDHRFSACVNVHISAHLFALAYNAVNGLQIEAQLMPILGSPTARAVQVAGRSGI